MFNLKPRHRQQQLTGGLAMAEHEGTFSWYATKADPGTGWRT